ncbi:Heparin and heparin-sulfate lyase [bioreactor metagenome]|uniref:Heparin and heparin-sulfate lyase n=1 Tax=bioreactor metagenome TaxID=1076179 RepID=A0A645GHI1_9ZZZZ
MFLNLKDAQIPAVLIVFDKVVSAKPDFKKFWLLHSIEEPQIAGNKVTIRRTKNGDTGMLVNTVLLPEINNADIVPVGGPGKEFWVFGTNYPNEPRPGDDEANERGAWRVEISPKKAATEDYYLNVMQVARNDQKNLLPVKRIDGDQIVGVQMAGRIVTFSKNSQPLVTAFDVNVSEKGNYKYILTDLMPGKWQVMKNGKFFLTDVCVSEKDGVLSFEGTAGKYKFIRQTETNNKSRKSIQAG